MTMKNNLLFFFLGVGSLAFSQGVFVPQQTAFKVVNGYTTPIANASITVCAANTSGIPCSPALVNAIFKDAALTQALSNPFTSDAFGNYQFASAGGAYTVTVTASGFVGSSYQVSTAGGIGAIPNPLNAVNLNVSGATNLNGFSSTGPGNWSNGFPAFGAPADPFCAYMVSNTWWQLCGLTDPVNGLTDLMFNDGIGTPNTNQQVPTICSLASFQGQGSGLVWDAAQQCFAFGEPILLNPGLPQSQAKECSSVTTDSSGGTVIAKAVLQSIDANNVGHDVLCVVTQDTAFPRYVGSIVFPYITAFGNSAASQFSPGFLEVMSKSPNIVLTNNSGATGGGNRKVTLNWRTCGGPGPTNCGTDAQFQEDPLGTGKEEYLWMNGGADNPLYIGGLGSNHPGIYFGSSNANVGAPFGFQYNPGGKSFLTRLIADENVWNGATLSSGTVTVSFANNQTGTAIPKCFITWQGGGTLTGILKCVVNGSTGAWTGITISSSVGTDSAVVAYLIVGDAF